MIQLALKSVEFFPLTFMGFVQLPSICMGILPCIHYSLAQVFVRWNLSLANFSKTVLFLRSMSLIATGDGSFRLEVYFVGTVDIGLLHHPSQTRRTCCLHAAWQTLEEGINHCLPPGKEYLFGEVFKQLNIQEKMLTCKGWFFFFFYGYYRHSWAPPSGNSPSCCVWDFCVLFSLSSLSLIRIQTLASSFEFISTISRHRTGA